MRNLKKTAAVLWETYKILDNWKQFNIPKYLLKSLDDV